MWLYILFYTTVPNFGGEASPPPPPPPLDETLMMVTIIVIKISCTFYRREGLFVIIMVTIKRPHILRLIDSLLGVKYIETDIHIHTTCLDVH